MVRQSSEHTPHLSLPLRGGGSACADGEVNRGTVLLKRRYTRLGFLQKSRAKIKSRQSV